MYHAQVVYHVYNHTNNFEPLFRSSDNYRFFLGKLCHHLGPCADFLAYCLMPDHFHLLLQPTLHGCAPSPGRKFPARGEVSAAAHYQQRLSHQLRVMLSSYTRAYNRRYGRRGSLLRAQTKARVVMAGAPPEDDAHWVVPDARALQYLATCFVYIHENPVRAGLVGSAEEWEFSSARNFAGQRRGAVCDYRLVERLLGAG